MFKKENYKRIVIKQIKKNSESTFSINEIDINDLEIINKFINNLILENEKHIINFIIEKRNITDSLNDILDHIIDDYEIIYKFENQRLILKDFIRTKDKYNCATNPYYNEYVHYVYLSYFL